MKNKLLLSIISIITLLVGIFSYYNLSNKIIINKLEATIISSNDELVILQDKNNIIYTINNNDLVTCYNGNVILEYTGIIDNFKDIQDISIINCEVVPTSSTQEMPDSWYVEGMFSKYYKLAYNKVKELTLDEKIAQILLVRYPDNNGENILKSYQFGGYVFYEKDFTNKSKEEVKKMMSKLQEVATIPILTAVDEEGGKVVRISSNPKLISTPYSSPSTLYNKGGMELISKDTKDKSKFLASLGINLNLAPVVDVVTDKNAYMYPRALQENTIITSEYASTVIKASKNTGVSYTLKHFPGYGNNADTHISSVTDTRSYDEIYANDLPPFESGINAGAEAVLIGHNKVIGIDANNIASLSPSIHNLLRNYLNFTGIIITDDLSMFATKNIDEVAVKAILAGNDLIISTDYEKDIKDIKNGINNGTISIELIDKLATRVIAWKYYKGLLFENQK